MLKGPLFCAEEMGVHRGKGGVVNGGTTKRGMKLNTSEAATEIYF